VVNAATNAGLIYARFLNTSGTLSGFRIVARQSESPGLECRLQAVHALALPVIAGKPPEGGTPTRRSENNRSLSVQKPQPG